jgi:hypothetical protein
VQHWQENGVKFAKIGDVEAAALLFVCDKSGTGRAASVWEGEPVDLGGQALHVRRAWGSECGHHEAEENET